VSLRQMFEILRKDIIPTLKTWRKVTNEKYTVLDVELDRTRSFRFSTLSKQESCVFKSKFKFIAIISQMKASFELKPPRTCKPSFKNILMYVT